jgi:hypothetical protein
MESFHATHGHIRLFALGVPEGWQAAIYDLNSHQWVSHQWVQGGGWIHTTVEDAKIDAKQRAEDILGKVLPDLDWK